MKANLAVDPDQSSNRGFASMGEKKQKEIASKGGKASGGNFATIPGAPPRLAAKAATVCGPRSAASRRTVSSHQKPAARAHSHGGR
jgi:uncharacterized protein